MDLLKNSLRANTYTTHILVRLNCSDDDAIAAKSAGVHPLRFLKAKMCDI